MFILITWVIPKKALLQMPESSPHHGAYFGKEIHSHIDFWGWGKALMSKQSEHQGAPACSSPFHACMFCHMFTSIPVYHLYISVHQCLCIVRQKGGREPFPIPSRYVSYLDTLVSWELRKCL